MRNRQAQACFLSKMNPTPGPGAFLSLSPTAREVKMLPQSWKIIFKYPVP
jgi:hypothetical protein